MTLSRGCGCSVALLWPGCRPLPDARPGSASAAARSRRRSRAHGRRAAAQPRHRRPARAGRDAAGAASPVRAAPTSRHAAYDDRPLPIGFGQTISQPYIVAFMTEALALAPTDVVLEIGTGSGLSGRRPRPSWPARSTASRSCLSWPSGRARTLAARGYRHVHGPHTATATRGWPERAPFTKIIVTAAPDEVPQALVDQLAVGGTMVVPVGPRAASRSCASCARPSAASSASAACRCDSCRW